MPRKKTTQPDQRLTYGAPVFKVADLNAEFKKTRKTRDDGSNDANLLDVFLKTMEFIASTTRSFTKHDVLLLMRVYQFPPLEIEKLLNKWADYMTSWHKLSVCQFVYDDAVYMLH